MVNDVKGAAVEIAEVTHGFPQTGTVLESLSLVIRPGEFVSLLGPSGCGKSTILRLIASLESARRGKIAVDSGARSFFRSFVFQEAHLMPWRSVLANVQLPLELMRRPREEAEEAAREALRKVGLDDALDRFPNQLSGGMKMRVSVARALVSKPSLLLLDEPFAALDESTRERLQEDLCELWEKEGMTVVFVTHSVSEAVFLSSRAIVLSARPGRVVLDAKIELGKRNARLRSDPSYWKTVAVVAEVFRKSGSPQGEVNG